MIKKIIFTLLIVFSFTLKSLGNVDFICKKEKDLFTNIFYLNGINKNKNNIDDETELRESVVRLRKNISPQLKTTSKLKFNYIENNSTVIIADLIKSFNQKVSEASLKDNIMFSSVASLFASKTVLSLVDNNNFKPLYERINKEVLTGHKIVIVSHSQGNLYANDVCRSLKTNNQLSESLKSPHPFINIQVATPASEVVCGSQYVSLKWDKVVNLTDLGSFIPGINIKSPLPGNIIHSPGFINKSGSGNSFLDHGFLDAYLDDPSVAYAVYSKVSNEVNLFPFHGFNEPIASYRVTGCPLTQHVKEDKFKNQILCKDAKEMDFLIKLQSNCEYNFTGSAKDSDGEVKFEADAPNYANIKVTYSPELGFKAEINPPDQRAPPFRSFFRIAGWVLGVSITLGGISNYKPLGRSNTDDEA